MKQMRQMGQMTKGRTRRAARRYTVSCLAFLLWLLPAPAASGQATGGDALPFPSGPVEPYYIIQPNDLLEIFVWDEPELSRQVLVRPDGRISVPLVQDVQAAGLSPPELKRRIEENLSEVIQVPNVTVIVVAIQSYRIFMTGQVLGPGAVVAEKALTVLEALALAGGFGEFPKRREIVIIRRNPNGTESRFPFDYEAVIEGRNPEQNILLQSGDMVVVPGG